MVLPRALSDSGRGTTLILALACGSVVAALAAADPAALALLPVVLAFLPLACGRFPGEDLLERARRRGRRRTSGRAPARLGAARPATRARVRGLVEGAVVVVRPPPGTLWA